MKTIVALMLFTTLLPFENEKLGLKTIWDGSNMVVISVSPGSSAYATGIKPGDVLHSWITAGLGMSRTEEHITPTLFRNIPSTLPQTINTYYEIKVHRPSLKETRDLLVLWSKGEPQAWPSK